MYLHRLAVLAALVALAVMPARAGHVVTYYDGPTGYRLGPNGPVSGPSRLGFGTAWGGAYGQRIEIDTTTWVGPGDAGFDPTHCTDEDAGTACSFAEALGSDRYITRASGLSGYISIPSVHENDGFDNGNFELSDLGGAAIRNMTLDCGGPVDGTAGIAFDGADFVIDGPTGAQYAENIVLLDCRHRGTDLPNWSLTAGISMSGCVRCAFINTSIAFPQTYLLIVGGNMTGHEDERNEDLTFINGLHAYSHVLGEHQGETATDRYVGNGTCSGDATRKCCVDGNNDGTLALGECAGVQTCDGETAATCRIEKTMGKLFSVPGASASPDAGNACDQDYDGAYAQCFAYCEGYGAEAGDKAGTDTEHGGPRRAYNGDECDTTTGSYPTGPWLTSGMDNYGVFISGNVRNISFVRNLMIGHRWRCPNFGPDTCSGDSCSTADETRAGLYDITQNWCYGGKLMMDSWTEHSSRDASIILSHNAHENNTETNTLYSDFWAGAGLPLGTTTASSGSFVTPTPPNTTAWGTNVKYYFDDNRDTHHSVGAEACYKNAGCGSAQAYSWSCSVGSGCTNVPGSDDSTAEGFYGQRGPASLVPGFPGTFAALRTVIAANAGAQRPCRDAVDRYAVELFEAGEALRVLHSRDEVGGYQQDMSVCPEDVDFSGVITVESKVDASAVAAANGSGIESTSLTVSTTETRMLNLHCGIETAGSVNARIRDQRASGGTINMDVDVGALTDTCVTTAYWCSIGDWSEREIGTVEWKIGTGSCT